MELLYCALKTICSTRSNHNRAHATYESQQNVQFIAQEGKLVPATPFSLCCQVVENRYTWIAILCDIPWRQSPRILLLTRWGTLHIFYHILNECLVCFPRANLCSISWYMTDSNRPWFKQNSYRIFDNFTRRLILAMRRKDNSLFLKSNHTTVFTMCAALTAKSKRERECINVNMRVPRLLLMPTRVQAWTRHPKILNIFNILLAFTDT